MENLPRNVECKCDLEPHSIRYADREAEPGACRRGLSGCVLFRKGQLRRIDPLWGTRSIYSAERSDRSICPEFQKLMDQYPDIRKGLTMPDGNIYSLPSFYDPELLSMLIGTPIWINQEWLDQLGMKEPQTTEEFYAYLKAVKETDLNGNGQHDEIPFSSTGITGIIDHLKGSWDLARADLAINWWMSIRHWEIALYQGLAGVQGNASIRQQAAPGRAAR